MCGWSASPGSPLFIQSTGSTTSSRWKILARFQYPFSSFCGSRWRSATADLFRKPLWTNRLYIVALVGLLGLTTYLVFVRDHWTAHVLQLVHLPMRARVTIGCAALINFACALVWDRIIVARILSRGACRRETGTKRYK
eukprot:Opistho-2@59294